MEKLEYDAMDVSYILDSLNEQQRNAVASPAQSLLVLAGAGSGKTRVLVHRIAWLLQAEHVSPFFDPGGDFHQQSGAGDARQN
jgi:hypothetical protein